MAGRRLSEGESALWARVTAGLRPLHPSRPKAKPVAPPPPEPVAAKPPRGRVPAPLVRAAPAPASQAPSNHLDGSWDRRIARGLVAPDSMIDLHGHSLASAHALLDRALERAIGRGDRVLLLVTGKAPRPEAERPFARGAIRAAVPDWLAASRHADRIAAVRHAHPRHGGAGALYVVLRRPQGRAQKL
ncbi:Smr/MutS family protein [Sphingomonas sp. PL-96]|uniref:Smr/MutS family protein n=1 Tax=Sphingomonas sp. PL-96 TaxID=2887201 RepID=UPI001E4066B6|nr:Smr/MutS family protein [Sphingomonas sp. PL-96]MCC2976338.1 Smr/MutS family protein [Sphingomonas sp. PL-96]